MGAIKSEMGSYKGFFVASVYQLVFSYTVALMIYQFGRVLVLKEAFNLGTGVAIVILLVYLYFIFRPDKVKEKEYETYRKSEYGI